MQGKHGLLVVLVLMAFCAQSSQSSSTVRRHSTGYDLPADFIPEDRRHTADNDMCTSQLLGEWWEQQMADIVAATDGIKYAFDQWASDIGAMIASVPDDIASFLGYADTEAIAIPSFEGEFALEALEADHNRRVAAMQTGETAEGDFEEEVQAVSSTHFAKGSLLGKGTFKTVYKGTYFAEAVAIAVMTPTDSRYFSSADMAMIEEEIVIQEKIREHLIGGRRLCRHFIPRLIGKHERRGSTGQVKVYTLIMELLGGDLHGNNYASEVHRSRGIALQMLYGTYCVHSAGYIHKDIKPLNFLISSDQKRVYTADFGLAATVGSSKMSSRAGTPPYMPGERASQSLALYDIFSLGKSMGSPWLGVEMQWNLPDGLVDQMTSPHYSNRPSIGKAIREIIELVLGDHMDAIRKGMERVAAQAVDMAEAQTQVQEAQLTIQNLSHRRETLRATPVEQDDDSDSFWNFSFLVCGPRKDKMQAFTKRVKLEKLDRIESRIGAARQDHFNARQAKERAQQGLAAAEAAVTQARTRVKQAQDALMLKSDPTNLLDVLMQNRPIPGVMG